MENVGYILRRQDTADQRISRIFFTKQGHQLKSQLARMEQKLQREFFQPLASQEVNKLSKQLNVLLENNGRAASDPIHKILPNAF